MFKVNNRNTRARCETYSKLKIFNKNLLQYMDSKKTLLAAKFHKFVSAEATKNNTFTIYQVPFKLQIKNFVNV